MIFLRFDRIKLMIKFLILSKCFIFDLLLFLQVFRVKIVVILLQIKLFVIGVVVIFEHLLDMFHVVRRESIGEDIQRILIRT